MVGKDKVAVIEEKKPVKFLTSIKPSEKLNNDKTLIFKRKMVDLVAQKSNQLFKELADWSAIIQANSAP
ncbi:MAG: hypothetical protein AAFR90_09450 [Pseudomonadota bacterium]